ncbi:MAG: hypothetical protein GTN49_11690 [candidate division Zixibacteria bacterium]|nr:hypothetical protein [candidate division Zixibacteria bacterium]
MRLLNFIVWVVATAASADVGSVISSFPWNATPAPGGIYRDASYVYAVVRNVSGPEFLRRYTTAGSALGSVPLAMTYPREGDLSHLGAAYLCVIDDDTDRLHVVNKTSGATASSFAVTGPGDKSPREVAWDGTYYYVGGGVQDPGHYNLYTAAGSLARSWRPAGWPSGLTVPNALAYSSAAAGKEGHYLLASSAMYSQPNVVIDMPSGSLVASWVMPVYNGAAGAVCGVSSRPGTYRAAYWANWNSRNTWYAFEFDIGAAVNPAVLPVSLGKIKAIYR